MVKIGETEKLRKELLRIQKKSAYTRFKKEGGISGASTRAQIRAELLSRKALGHEAHKAKKYLGKEFKSFFGLHSNPTGFIKMIHNNTRLTDRQKQKAFRTYIRNHRR